jgi:TPR repeat protein
MKTKPLTFLLCFTSLFLFNSSSVVFADDYQDATDAYQRKDYKEGFRLWLPLAEQGTAQAQFNIGIMYEEELEVLQDYKEALRWYRFSAEQGKANFKKIKPRTGTEYS